MQAHTPTPPIDTGTAPEIYTDDLGSIELMSHTVCWTWVRQHGEDRVTVVKVITPLNAVPVIAAQMAAAFAGMLTRRAAEKLREIAGMTVQ